MGVRNTVFGSKMERKCFAKLQKTWGDKYNVYHNLPFLNVFDPKSTLVDDRGNPFEISDDESDFLKKTSIDFTVCDKEDSPLVCIEFDGMQGGVNVGTTYLIPDGSDGGRKRRAILELKLRVAHGSGFPYFILGSDQFRGLSDGVYLTIADALIGEVMSTRAWAARMGSEYDPRDYGYSSEEWDELDLDTRRSIVDDWAIGVEVGCDYEYNPIFGKVAELFRETGSSGWSMLFLNDEELDRDIWIWMECEIINYRHGNARVKVYLPNFRTPHCYFTAHIAQEIAKLLALEKIRSRMKRKKASGRGSQDLGRH
ncbi:MAG: hypothetical protein WBG50_24260 [Desulfomonilaceae bacterium]